MPEKNKSVVLFEEFCELHRLNFIPLPETDQKTPDYMLSISGEGILVELKELEPNEKEKDFLKLREQGKIKTIGCKPGKRLRDKIRAANKQLKQGQSGNPIPTLLVVFNNTPCRFHTDPYSVMTAMQGMDTIEIEVPQNKSESLKWGETRSGKEKAMRADANTSISAIGILRVVNSDYVHLDVYHNRYSTCTLDPSLLATPGIFHFRLSKGAKNSIDNTWEEVF